MGKFKQVGFKVDKNVCRITNYGVDLSKIQFIV